MIQNIDQKSTIIILNICSNVRIEFIDISLCVLTKEVIVIKFLENFNFTESLY